MKRPLDVGALSSAASRPGIDPRTWVTLAVVTELGFDPVEGTFADVKFVPGGENETCYVGTQYAGAGFGENNPLKVDDLVVVVVPMGDPGLGPVIIARFNNKADPPPPDFAEGDEPSSDRIIRVEPLKNFKVFVTGTGKLTLASEGVGGAEIVAGAGMIDLGAPLMGTPAADFVALSTLVLAELTRISVELNALKAATAVAVGSTVAAPPGTNTAAASAFGTATATTVGMPPKPVAATKVRAT